MSEHPGLLAAVKDSLGKLAAQVGFDPKRLIGDEVAIVTNAMLSKDAPAEKAPQRPQAVRPGSLGDISTNRRIIRAQHRNAL